MRARSKLQGPHSPRFKKLSKPSHMRMALASISIVLLTC